MKTAVYHRQNKKSSGDTGAYFAKIRLQRILRTTLCIILCFMSLLPFALLFVNATRDSNSIKMGITLIPGGDFFTNWNNLIANQAGFKLTIWRSMLNSFLIAVPATVLSVYFSTLTAYGLHVYNFRMKKFAWSFIMAIMIVPTQISIIGFYKFMLKLHLTDTYVPLILPAIATPTVVFFMRQYMRSALSVEMIEAARIDGSGEFKTFNIIAAPLMKPALATQAIFQFVFSWNNLFTPTVILTSDAKKTLPMYVQTLTSNQMKTDYGMVYAGLAVAVLPLFVVYFLLSKYIVAGVTLGGVKE